ncbi:hypothetical protein EG328_003257 [Venturia inaequalis]|uniref:Uncharacterized protein n=1 Tax=Venturia inaequalis TaxID=5025 RepID=A0A8H3ZAV2_VENIN|nr:hypothetical protein EG328_003257 [Venturia inaequalis]KAE9992695.1 hypothetical protein EG327_008125 [Venturia inaequalis]RDI81235.1 Cullin-3 [Venturia inaequalis]
MLSKTSVLAVVVTFAAAAQANCAAGKILGKFALCGSNPVDCGSGLCCQQGAKCVPDDTAGFRCGMPLASIDPKSTTNNTVLLNAGCYDVVDRKTTPSSTLAAPIAPDTGSPSPGPSQASTQDSPSSSPKVSKGGLAGIIVGSIIAGILLIAIIVASFLLAQRRRNDAPTALSIRREMGERSDTSISALQKPAPAILGERSSTAKPRPIVSGFSR